MKIGIMGAMKEEVSLLLKETRSVSRKKIGLRTYYSGRLYRHNVVLTTSGWGKVASCSTATVLLSHFGIDMLLFFGTAGAVDTRIEIGDIVIATELIQYDLDPRPIYPRYKIPGLGISKIPTDAQLRGKAYESARDFIINDMKSHIDEEVLKKFEITKPKVHRGLIGSGDSFISSISEKNKIHRQIRGIKCVEMEGAAVAQVCFEYNKVPFIVVRVISDKADKHAEINFPLFLSKVAGQYTVGIVKRLFKLM